MTTATATQRPTAQQTADIKDRLRQLEDRGEPTQWVRDAMNAKWLAGEFDGAAADDAIRNLRDLVDGIDFMARQARDTIPSGRYAVRTGNAPDAPYAFYRVWKGDRATLVFLQISDDQQRLSRPAANGVLRKIGFDVKEAACAYGREIGVCGVCNRTLTDPDSIALGIGPVCATRL